MKSIFPFAMPVLNDDGIPKGAIIIGVELSQYSDIFKKSYFHEGAFFGICDQNGIRLLRNPVAPSSAIGKPIKSLVFQAASNSGKPGIVKATDSNGIDRIIAYEPMRLAPETTPYMYVFMGLDQSKVVAFGNDNLLRGAIISFISLSIALILAWTLGWKSVASNIRKLALVALDIGRGKSPTTSDMDYTDGEIGQLAQSFDTMAMLLKKREDDLSAARKTAESANKALQLNMAHMRTIVETMPDLVWLKDTQGVYIFCNRRFERLFGASEVEIVGKTDYDFVDKDLADFFRQNDRLALNAGKSTINEETLTYKDDGHTEEVETVKTPMLNEEGKVIGVLGMGRDITSRKRSEEVLRESEIRFKALHNASFGGIAIHDKGIILECNRGLSDITGYEHDELNGMDGLLLIAEQSREMVMGNIVSGHEEPYEAFGARKDGTEYPVRLEARNIPYKGRMVRVVEFRDITERKKTEEILQNLIAKLEDKNDELERFTYTVSHDLKSPLITIKGFAGMLQKDINAGKLDHAEQSIMRIDDAAAKMFLLLEDLLELSRIGRMDTTLTDLDFNELVAEVVETLDGPLKANNCRLSIMKGLPVIQGDRLRLMEVMQNLIENAIKFSSNNSSPAIEVGMRDEVEERVFYVADNGSGIEPRYADRVFNLFEKLDPCAEGTGVGLALVKRIVEHHNGKIWVESEGKDTGTRLCFTLAPNTSPQSDDTDSCP